MKPVTQDEAHKNTYEMARSPSADVVVEPAIPVKPSTVSVCKHGSLRRQCYVCELEEDLAEAHTRIAKLEADIERYRVSIDRIARILSPPEEGE